MLEAEALSRTSILIESLELDRDTMYKCVRRGDCSNCLCDDVRYSTCQFITPWSKFSREYPSLTALLMEKLSEKMRDKNKIDWRPYSEEKPGETDSTIAQAEMLEMYEELS